MSLKGYSIVILICEECLDTWEDGMPFYVNESDNFVCERCGRNFENVEGLE